MRGGKEFSPFSNPPIKGAFKFDVKDALIRENDQRIAKEMNHEDCDSDVELDISDRLDTTTPISTPRQQHAARPLAASAPTTGQASTSAKPLGKRQKKTAHNRDKRRAKRATAQQSSGTKLKGIALKRCAQATPQGPSESASQFDASSDFPVATSGWVGAAQQYAKETPTLDHLLKECGMKLVELKEGYVSNAFQQALPQPDAIQGICAYCRRSRSNCRRRRRQAKG